MIMFNWADLGALTVIVLIIAALVGKVKRGKSESKPGESGGGSNIYNDDSYWS